jgi:hypothetical protein
LSTGAFSDERGCIAESSRRTPSRSGGCSASGAQRFARDRGASAAARLPEGARSSSRGGHQPYTRRLLRGEHRAIGDAVIDSVRRRKALSPGPPTGSSAAAPRKSQRHHPQWHASIGQREKRSRRFSHGPLRPDSASAPDAIRKAKWSSGSTRRWLNPASSSSYQVTAQVTRRSPRKMLEALALVEQPLRPFRLQCRFGHSASHGCIHLFREAARSTSSWHYRDS